MDIKTQFSTDKKTFTISVEGDFNFSMRQKFKSSYTDNDAILADNIIIDFMKTKTIDSSALGMLLDMQKDLEKSGDVTKIINSNEMIMNILKITSFYKKFTIE